MPSSQQTKRNKSKSSTVTLVPSTGTLVPSSSTRRSSHSSKVDEVKPKPTESKPEVDELKPMVELKPEAEDMRDFILSLEKKAKLVPNRTIKYVYSPNFTTLMQLAILHRVQNKCKISPLQITPPPYKAADYREYIKETAPKVAECITRGSTVIGIPVYITLEDETSHTNMLVYKVGEKAAYLYEPHGSEIMLGEDGFSDYLKDTVKKVAARLFKPRPFKFYPPENICPNLGVQYHENLYSKSDAYDGFCSAWICFYLDMVLSHPKLGMSEINDILMQTFDENPKKLFRLVFGYIAKMKREVDAYVARFPSIKDLKQKELYGDDAVDIKHIYEDITPEP